MFEGSSAYDRLTFTLMAFKLCVFLSIVYRSLRLSYTYLFNYVQVEMFIKQKQFLNSPSTSNLAIRDFLSTATLNYYLQNS